MVCVVLVSWFIVDVQRLLDTSFFWNLIKLDFWCRHVQDSGERQVVQTQLVPASDVERRDILHVNALIQLRYVLKFHAYWYALACHLNLALVFSVCNIPGWFFDLSVYILCQLRSCLDILWFCIRRFLIYLLYSPFIFIQAPKRNHEFSTPKKRSTKEMRWKIEVRSAPNEIGSKSRKRRKTKYEGQVASASKQKPRHGWLTEHPGDSFSSRFKTSVVRSPAASSCKRTYQGASPHSSASRSSRKPYWVDYNNNSSNGSANFPQHRYLGSRYGNNG